IGGTFSQVAVDQVAVDGTNAYVMTRCASPDSLYVLQESSVYLPSCSAATPLVNGLVQFATDGNYVFYFGGGSPTPLAYIPVSGGTPVRIANLSSGVRTGNHGASVSGRLLVWIDGSGNIEAVVVP